MSPACVRLHVEELEGRTLPSASPVSLPALTAALAAPATPIAPLPAIHVLSGQGEGTFAVDAIQSGAGTVYHFYGEGQFAALGHVGIRGDVHAVGFLVHGQAAGTLTLTNDHGSVTLTLTGPDQPGFSALPQQFSYKITGGTGAYAHLSDQGTLSLMLAAAPTGPGSSIPAAPHGAFALSVAQPGQPGAALDGALAGHVTPAGFIAVDPMPVDVGAVYGLSGAGTLAELGSVTLTGSLRATGFVGRGHATGELTISSAHGSVTLDLRGPAQGTFAPLPGQFDFNVRSGTGAYTHLHAGGTVTVRFDLSGGTFTLAIVAA